MALPYRPIPNYQYLILHRNARMATCGHVFTYSCLTALELLLTLLGLQVMTEEGRQQMQQLLTQPASMVSSQTAADAQTLTASQQY